MSIDRVKRSCQDRLCSSDSLTIFADFETDYNLQTPPVYVGASNGTLTNGPTVPGAIFDRLIQKTPTTPKLPPLLLSTPGIALPAYCCVTHTNEPNNYLATGGGDFWGFNGHDTDIAFAADWLTYWLVHLLQDSTFNANGTLILLTFEQVSGLGIHPLGLIADRLRNETTSKNQEYSILLDGAVPAHSGKEVREKKNMQLWEMSIEQDPVDRTMNEGEVILPERCRRKEWKRGQSCKISPSVNARCHTMSQRQIGTPRRPFGAERRVSAALLKRRCDLWPADVAEYSNRMLRSKLSHLKKMEEMDNSI
ncbi:hypothetical protein BU15DRAFT_59598 [Melanogaster broomeanus]|nr:hypothetical protein BU15DRAFT_59598 [Melanogaster broomeanus]